MKKVEFGFIQGRMISPPSKNILQYFPKKDWKKEFEYASKNGFDFIEYFGERKFNKDNPIWSSRGLKEIKSLAKNNNLSNYSFCDDYFISKNFIKYKDFNNYYTKITNNLSVIGIKIYVLALFEKSQITKHNFKNFIKRLQNISDKLKKKKIKLALEINLDANEIINLVELINRKNVFIVYDTGNRLKKKNFQYNEIIKLKKYICHFHIKDKNWNGDNVILGSGNVKFQQILRAIRQIKYKGKYTFETNRGENPIKTMRENKIFILNLMNYLNTRRGHKK